jgi:hypothetical protein
MPDVMVLHPFDPDTRKVDRKRATPVVGVQCQTPGCGYMMMFSATTVGLVSEERS